MFRKAISLSRVLLLAGAIGALASGARANPPSRGGGAHLGFPHSGFHYHGFQGHDFRGNSPGYGGNYRPNFVPPPPPLVPPGSWPLVKPYGLSSSSYYQGAHSRRPDDVPPEPEPKRARIPREPVKDEVAYVVVKVPADAELWFDGKKTKATGTFRTFVTPKLETGRRYTYEVRARWREGDQEITRTRTARVEAGGEDEVDFTAAQGKRR